MPTTAPHQHSASRHVASLDDWPELVVRSDQRKQYYPFANLLCKVFFCFRSGVYENGESHSSPCQHSIDLMEKQDVTLKLDPSCSSDTPEPSCDRCFSCSCPQMSQILCSLASSVQMFPLYPWEDHFCHNILGKASPN